MCAAKFDPNRQRETFEEFAVSFVNETEHDPSKPMGLVAQSQAQYFVYAALVGVYSRLAAGVPERISWIDADLKAGAKYGETLNYSRTNLLRAKAIYQWLRNADPAVETWRELRVAHQEALFEPGVYAKRDIFTSGLDEHTAFCFLAKDYDRGIASYEQAYPQKSLPIKGSPQLRDVGYLLCVQAARGGLDEQHLNAATRRMLRAHLDDLWLGRGQSVRAAMWLMAIHWYPECKLTPVQTLLKAYEDMPSVEQPTFAI